MSANWCQHERSRNRGVKVDISEGCGGVWFDFREFEKFDEVHEVAGDKLVGHMKSLGKGVTDLSKRLNCPRCPETVLMRHFSSPLRKIEIDRCPGCGGVWMDLGELAHYRKLFPTEQDRRKVGEEFIEKNILPLLAAKRQEEQEKLKGARKLANMFRFICPSFYISGKQEGAAF